MNLRGAFGDHPSEVAPARPRLSAAAVRAGLAALLALLMLMTGSPIPPSLAQAPPPGTVLLQDTFDSPGSGHLSRSSRDPDNYTVGYERGEYFIRLVNPDWDRFPFTRIPGTYDDAVLAIDVRLVGPVEGRFISIGCRDQGIDPSYEYRLTVTPWDGEFRLSRIYDGTAFPMVDWQSSPAILPGNQQNRIELSCIGETISVIINGFEVAAVEDFVFPAGEFWIGVGTLVDVTGTAEARFDNLMITQG